MSLSAKKASVIVNDIDESVAGIDKLHGYKKIHSVCDTMKSFFDKKYSSYGDGGECVDREQAVFEGCVLDEHNYYKEGEIDLSRLWQENEKGVSTIEIKIKDALSKGNIPLLVGGSHGVSYNSVKTIRDSTKEDIGLVYFDSHSDCGKDCESYVGTVDRCSWVKKLIDDKIVKPENIVHISNNPETIGEENYCTEKGAVYINEAERQLSPEGSVELLDKLYSSLESLTKRTKRIYISYDRDYNNKDGVAIPSRYEGESIYPKIDALKESGAEIVGADIQEYFPPNEKTTVGLFGPYSSTRRGLYYNLYEMVKKIR